MLYLEAHVLQYNSLIKHKIYHFAIYLINIQPKKEHSLPSLQQMPNHILQLSYQQFVKNNKSIADTKIADYYIYDKIGSGAFGSVYKGMDDRTKKQVAFKVLDLVAIDRQQGNPKVKQIRRRLAKSQSELMAKVNSDHVMKLFDVFQNKWLKIMVVQYCNGDTLANQIMYRKKIPQNQAIEVIKQIILGISDMHKENIVHRDLKSDNIMSHNGVYKIVDLGFAKKIPAESDIYGTVLGTIITMAPEVMRREKYGLKADIWSIGVIFYQMIYGRLPYQAMKSVEMYEQILKKDIFPNGGKINGVVPSKQAMSLMKKLLVVDHHQRLGWQQLISQQIFKSKHLPDEYRMTVNIDHLKNQKVAQRNDQEELEKIQQQKSEYIEKETVKIEKLTTKQKEKKIKQVDKTEVNIVQWAITNHLECLKTQLIFRDIIMPIEQRNMLNLQDRKSVQLMYLLSSRCFINMSFVKNDFVDSQNPIVVNLKKTVQMLYKEVAKKFFYYCDELRKQEDKVSSIIGDRFGKMFKSTSFKQKDKFLTGVQNIDFTKQQQIWYTYEQYIKQLMPLMKNKDIKARAKMENYKEINDVAVKDLKDKKFYDRVQEIIDGAVSVIKQSQMHE